MKIVHLAKIRIFLLDVCFSKLLSIFLFVFNPTLYPAPSGGGPALIIGGVTNMLRAGVSLLLRYINTPLYTVKFLNKFPDKQ